MSNHPTYMIVVGRQLLGTLCSSRRFARPGNAISPLLIGIFWRHPGPPSERWTPSCGALHQRALTGQNGLPRSLAASETMPFSFFCRPLSSHSHIMGSQGQASHTASLNVSIPSFSALSEQSSSVLQSRQRKSSPRSKNLKRISRNMASLRDEAPRECQNHEMMIVVAAILAINLLVFLAWRYAENQLLELQDPRLFLFMTEHFSASPMNLYHWRWWTLFTSCFSHREPMHLLFNMVTFATIAPPILALTGTASFLGLYLGASMLTNFMSMVSRWYLLSPQEFIAHKAIGASGSVYALMTAFTCVQPTAIFLLFLVVPVPAWAVVGGIFAFDAYRAAATPRIRTDAAGHVGGIVAGILFWVFKLKRLRIPRVV